MAIHIEDKEADTLVREFARRRGVGITAAIKIAINEINTRERQGGEALRVRIEPILKEIRAARKRPFSAAEDKAFMDEMWGEES